MKRKWNKFKKESAIHDYTQIVACEKTIVSFIKEQLRDKQDLICMEEVNKTIVSILDGIEEHMVLNRAQEDLIDKVLSEHIEKLCNYPRYRNYN